MVEIQVFLWDYKDFYNNLQLFHAKWSFSLLPAELRKPQVLTPELIFVLAVQHHLKAAVGW